MSKGRGKTLEGDIDRANALYRERGSAFVVRQEIPTTRVRGRLQLCNRALPDYMGVIGAFWVTANSHLGPIPVMMEAKETHRARWPISGLEAHQLAAMLEFERIGGLAFVYVAYITDTPHLLTRRDFVIPVGALSDPALPRTLPPAIAEQIGARVPIPGQWLGPVCDLAISGNWPKVVY